MKMINTKSMLSILLSICLSYLSTIVYLYLERNPIEKRRLELRLARLAKKRASDCFSTEEEQKMKLQLYRLAKRKKREAQTEEEQMTERRLARLGMKRKRETHTEEEQRLELLSTKLAKREKVSVQKRILLRAIDAANENENSVTQNFCGRMDEVCSFCQSKNFLGERPKDGKYTQCCQKGKVALKKRDNQFPFKELMNGADENSKLFMDKIRSYNSSFGFASMGANINLPWGRGPKVFRIQGQIYHCIGPLHPGNNEKRKFAQFYIMESEDANVGRLALEENKGCDKKIMKKIENELRNNPFAKTFKWLHEVEKEETEIAKKKNAPIPDIKMAIKHDRNQDVRRYNKAKVNEVAVVFENKDGTPPFNRDIIIHLRPVKGKPSLQRINILNPNVDPLIYPLFFPRGEQGWNINLKLTDGKRMTMLQYYSALLSVRDSFNPLLNGGSLTQQFIVDAYCKIEGNRINYVEQNQKHLRVDKYSSLKNHLQETANASGRQLGKMVILPSTFEGSPRNQQERFRDAMAIVTKFGKPDLFITMTCNPKWREITDNLEPWQKVEHRPDLVARVFKLKLKSLLADLDQGLFGVQLARVHVIEFQKRGLPHAHILLILDSDSKLKTEEDIDRIVSAEIPDKVKFPKLYEIVTKNMIHNPCGIQNHNAPCMQNGKCMREFPKEFCESTVKNVNGYPKYKRRHGIKHQVRNQWLDNSWVVPYNRYLLLKYNCHINVEVCASIQSIKYLYKYIYKGHDCANVEIRDSNYDYNEAAKHIDSRYVSAPEAIWRIFAFPMHKQSHAVTRLAVHLPDEQSISFNQADEINNLESKLEKHSTLMAWFKLNQTDENARQYLYNEIPLHYVFIKNEWKKRKVRQNTIIGRMHAVGLNDTERYFLRLNLLHVKGAKSFADLRTVDGVIYPNFRETAIARGLLLDDDVWRLTLSDAVVCNQPKQLRELFAYICVFGSPRSPKDLYLEFKSDMMEDYCYLLHKNSPECKDCEDYTLRDINLVLNNHRTSCTNYDLPSPKENLPEIIKFINTKQEAETAEKMKSTLNAEQKMAFDLITAAVLDKNEKHNCFYIDGPGGSGKTYLYNCMIHFMNGIGKKVITSASTGIAAILLPGGRTIHSTYGIPVPVNETSVSHISVTSKQAQELRTADLFIIDECTMVSNHAIDCIDRLLKEITGNMKPFGGKVILLGGDFRQCLPVMPHAMKAAIIQGSIKFSNTWNNFKRIELKTNQRSTDLDYSNWILKLGNGQLSIEGMGEETIEIPPDVVCKDVVTEIFGENVLESNQLHKRTILCPLNEDVDKLNEKIMDKIEGEYKIYLSNDSIENEDVTGNNFPVEFLNTLTPSGMPQHKLKLKNGSIIMLLRNLNINKGLCNGTRLKVKGLMQNVIIAEILCGSFAGENVLIPRIDLCPSETGLPFQLKRRQFPVKVAFAMTINKSQGQTFDRVGIYLAAPVFGHGQLYVAFSRVRKRSDVKIQIERNPLQGNLTENEKVFTQNVVYKEILQ